MRIGIDLGGSHIGTGLVDNYGKILIKKERNFSKDDKINIEFVVEESIKKHIDAILKETDKENIEYVGISTPGVIVDGCITKTTNLKINKLDITNIIKSKIDVPIFMENDGICAAIGEKYYGNLKDCENGAFVGIGTGIGSAVFINKNLMKEIRRYGHHIIQVNGKKCKCGKRGCFEAYCSMKALKTQIRDKINKPQMSSMEILEVLKNREYSNITEKIIEKYIKYLAVGISNIISTCSIDTLVIGGSFIYYKDILFTRLIEELRNQDLLKKENVEVRLAKLGNDAGIIGAAKIGEMMKKQIN